jgi:hypothetical protein
MGCLTASVRSARDRTAQTTRASRTGPSTTSRSEYAEPTARPAFGYWPPWVAVDLDRDGRTDVVATVVKRVAGKTLFGVVAVHAQAPMTIYWVVGLQAHIINGVAVGGFSGRDTVTPLFCLECDALSWFRWSGKSYEAELYAVGERLTIATYPERRTLTLFEQPRLDSRPSGSVKECTQANVLQVRGTSRETRWYFVEALLTRRVRGWVPASFTLGAQCIG